MKPTQLKIGIPYKHSLGNNKDFYYFGIDENKFTNKPYCFFHKIKNYNEKFIWIIIDFQKRIDFYQLKHINFDFKDVEFIWFSEIELLGLKSNIKEKLKNLLNR